MSVPEITEYIIFDNDVIIKRFGITNLGIFTYYETVVAIKKGLWICNVKTIESRKEIMLSNIEEDNCYNEILAENANSENKLELLDLAKTRYILESKDMGNVRQDYVSVSQKNDDEVIVSNIYNYRNIILGNEHYFTKLFARIPQFIIAFTFRPNISHLCNEQPLHYEIDLLKDKNTNEVVNIKIGIKAKLD